MNVEDLPENSDSSDEDYVPNEKAEEALSEVDSDGDPEDPLSDTEPEPKRKGQKRTKKLKRSLKKAKLEEDKSATQSKEGEEEKKKKEDDLWADFMKDTGFKPKNIKTETSSAPTNSCFTKTQLHSDKDKHQKKDDNKVLDKPAAKVKITQIFEFAGEEVKVEKEVDPSSAEARLLSQEVSKSSKAKKVGGLSGIGNVLSHLGKKQKINTLEKTKLDWDRFKREENIEEELETHNKGKDGYLERQDFLQRADLRRFEIEKDLRNSERAKRFNSTL